MNVFATLSLAINEAFRQYRTGFMSDGKKTIFKNGLGQFVVVGDSAFASGPIVASVYRGVVHRA